MILKIVVQVISTEISWFKHTWGGEGKKKEGRGEKKLQLQITSCEMSKFYKIFIDSWDMHGHYVKYIWCQEWLRCFSVSTYTRIPVVWAFDDSGLHYPLLVLIRPLWLYDEL